MGDVAVFDFPAAVPAEQVGNGVLGAAVRHAPAEDQVAEHRRIVLDRGDEP